MKNDFIKFIEKNNTGIVILDRPKSLNSINYEMVERFLEKLDIWKSDNNIKRILVKGEGKAFCAGGDVKSLVLSFDKDNLKKKFFQKEYTLNNLINEFQKEYMSIWDGIVMGGGVGLSIYGNYRITTEKTIFAMPETAIGFFPDVGGSYFLSRLKKGKGVFLGLTGHVCNAYDIIELGIATHYVSSELLPKIIEEYIEEGDLNCPIQKIEIKSSLKKNENLIEDIFQENLKDIMIKLKKTKDQFGQKIYSHLISRCPMSLAVTEKLINNAKSKSLSECLENEYQLCQNMVYRNDFDNGVNAVLVNKTHQPIWHPSSLDKINSNEVDKMFEHNVEKLYL